MALKRATLLLMLALVWISRVAQAEEPKVELLSNGGFEGPYHDVNFTGDPVTRIAGRIADGWQDNSSWARVVVRYDEVTAGVHGGRSAQRITTDRIATGSVQLVHGGLSLKQGAPYRAQIYARSDAGVPLTLQIRQPGPPYTSYAEQNFGLGPQWRPCELFFTSPVNGPALFMILPGDLGTLELDDASLAPAAAAGAPPRHGNLLVTGRAVGALANGWAPSNAPFTAFRYLPPSPEKPYPEVVIDGSAGRQPSLYSPPVVVNAGRVHTLSLDLKSDPPGAEVWLTVHDARQDSVGIHRSVTATGDWQRCVLRGQLPFVPASAFAVRICAVSKAQLHVRNVQLVEGESPTEFEPAVPVELAIVPTAPNGLVFDGQAAELHVEAAGPIPEHTALHLRVCDLYGSERELDRVVLGGTDSASLNVRVPPPQEHPRGMFRIEGELLDSSGRSISNLAQALVARVPRPRYPDRLMLDSAFGVHIPLDDAYTRLAQNLGFKWCRIHDASAITKWPSAEPERGQFQFFDDQVKLARSRGIMVLGMLDAAAPWACDVPKDFGNGYFRGYFKPRVLADWRAYVHGVVAHYRGLIDHWEVWNEPWAGGFFRKMQDGRLVQGTPEDYVPLLKAAYEEAKKANPDAVVLGLDSNPPEWTQACLKDGAAGSMDVFSFHQYTRRLAGARFGALEELLEQHKALLAEYDLGGLPVWNTEGGPDIKEDTFYRDLDLLATSDGHREAVWHARYYLATMSLGIRKFFLYTLHAHPRLGQHTWVRLEPAGYLKPWAIAQANIANLLEGTQFIRRIDTESGLVCLLFEGDGRKIAALFSADGRPVTAAALKGLPVTDLYGNAAVLGEVTLSPVYALGENVGRVLAALE